MNPKSKSEMLFKQMSLQLFPKHLHAGALAYIQWQPVPQQGSREREGPLPGFSARPGLAEKQSTTGAKRAGRMIGYQLATQVLWGLVMKAFVCQ